MNRRRNIHLVLRHDGVLSRCGDTMHASITQVDLHDFCRLTRTYGLAGFHCVTQLEAQHQICADMMDYWQNGPGLNYNPDRADALSCFRLHSEFEELIQSLKTQYDQPPLLIGTSACKDLTEKILDFDRFSDTILRLDRPILIQFGTSWGLSPEQLNRCDRILSPIQGCDGYNHLSVRCAAAIIVDRLFH